MADKGKNSLDFPKIRTIDAAPAMSNERSLMMLFDPTRISDKVMLVAKDILYILQFFDGHHSLLDIRAEYMRKFGTFLYEDRLLKIVEELDVNLLLDNERFRSYYVILKEEYNRHAFRKSILAGESYDSDPQRLREEVKDYFSGVAGPGLPSPPRKRSSLSGIIAPHIDIRAGGPCYACAYKALAESEPVDLFVILGTCHSPLQKYFAGTGKDFQTPLGIAKTDLDFMETLEAHWQGDLFKDEMMHQVEHTIEFQLIFLQFLFHEKFKIAPLLCSFSYEDIGGGDGDTLPRFFDVLKRAIATYPGRVCMIASVDFSHIGRRYGDAQPPDANIMSLVRRHDLELVNQILALDAEGFLTNVATVRNRYRLCGLAPIYTMLKSITAAQGSLLKYDSATVDGTGSVVTFASAIFKSRE